MQGRPLAPRAVPGDVGVRALVDEFFLAYNAARLREACRIFALKMLEPDVTVGLTISGALTPRGSGPRPSCPSSRRASWTGSCPPGPTSTTTCTARSASRCTASRPQVDDLALRRDKVIRIYDIVFDQDVLFKTDAFLSEVLKAPEFQHRMGTAELHWRLGRYALEREKSLGAACRSLLGAAHLAGVPIYTSSPGDSGVGMNLAALRLQGLRGRLRPRAGRQRDRGHRLRREAVGREERRR